MHNKLEGKGIRNARDIQPQEKGMSIRKIHAAMYGIPQVGAGNGKNGNYGGHARA